MIAGNRNRVEIFHLIFNKKFLNVPHHFEGELDREDTRVLALVLFQDIRLDRTSDIGEDKLSHFLGFGFIGFPPFFRVKLVDLLIDGRIHEHGKDNRGRAINGHGDGSCRRAEIKTIIEQLDIVKGTDTYPGCAYFPVDIRAFCRIPTVQRD